MVMRISSGVKGLDKLMQGGFPEESMSLLYGHPGSGKSTFVLNFINNTLKQKKKVLLILTYEPSLAFRKKMGLYGMNPDDKNLVIIDCYSYAKEEEGYTLKNLSNLNELNMLIKKAIEENNFKKGVVIIDSVSDLLLYNNEKAVYKFLQMLRGKIIALNSIGLIILEEGIHEKTQFFTINYLADATIHMEVMKDKRFIKIERMHNTNHPLNWIEFNITPDARIRVREFFK